MSATTTVAAEVVCVLDASARLSTLGAFVVCCWAAVLIVVVIATAVVVGLVEN